MRTTKVTETPLVGRTPSVDMPDDAGGLRPTSQLLDQSMSNDSILDDEILDEPGVCHNCFRKTHDLEEIDYPNRVENRPITGTTLRRERFFKRPDSTEKVFPVFENPAHSPAGRNICLCGVVNSTTKRRPLSKERMIEYTDNLSNRLDEMHIIHDRDVLFDYVRREKEKAERQHEDDQIFAEAVSRAVSHAQAKSMGESGNQTNSGEV